MASKVSSIFRADLVKGKSAVVTGGATGIGCAIAQELLHLGCKVLVASRKIDEHQVTINRMKSLLSDPEQLKTTQCNIRKEEEIEKMISTAVSEFGAVDFLVNNAGGQFMAPAEKISLKGWNAVVETNLTGTFLCSREAYNQHMKEHGGSIVNIIVDMFKGFPSMSPSGAARAGVDNLTKSLALEWAPAGVRVNCVAPGSSIYSDTAAKNYGSWDVFGMQVPRIPAKRLGTTEEISGVVCFLLSPAASFITGETVKVEGGQHLYTPSLPWEVPNHTKFPKFSWEDSNKS